MATQDIVVGQQVSWRGSGIICRGESMSRQRCTGVVEAVDADRGTATVLPDYRRPGSAHPGARIGMRASVDLKSLRPA